MADKASLFSTTATLVNESSALSYDADGMANVPPDDCFAILLVHHDGIKFDTAEFSKAGFPAMFARLDGPSSQRSGLKKLTLKKRMQVQFPKRTLGELPVFRRKVITTLEEVIKRREDKTSSHGKRRTMFDLMEDDIVAIQTRRTIDIALAMLFQGRDTNSPTLYYHASNINYMPAWAVDKDNLSFAAVPAQWATIAFLSPEPSGGAEVADASAAPPLTTTGENGEERDEAYKLHDKETDEQVLQRLFVPDEQSELLLKRLLSHLGSRGVMWARAGHFSRPSQTNPTPRTRPEFVVIGLFPKPFTLRCQAFRQQGVPWSADTTEPPKSKRAPLILSTDSSGINLDDAASSNQKDFLEGWKIRMTKDEPARTGSYWEDAGGVSMAFAGVGGGM